MTPEERKQTMEHSRLRFSAKLWMLSTELMECFHEAMGICIASHLSYDLVTELRQAQLRIHAVARAIDTGEPLDPSIWDWSDKHEQRDEAE